MTHVDLKVIKGTLGKLISSAAVVFLGVAVCDAVEFNRIAAGRFPTPWYAANWATHPYTNARLALEPHLEYWKPNGIGTEL